MIKEKYSNDDGKGEDIHKQDIISQYAAVGEENHGDGRCSCQS